MKSKVFCFLVAAVASLMLFGTVSAHAGVEYVNGDPVYKASDESNLLGIAADFGVFADEVEMTAHAETNVACNSLVFQTLEPTTGGILYARQFIEGQNLNYSYKYQAFLPKYSKMEFIVGSRHELTKNSDGTWNVDGRKVSCNFKPTEFINEGSVPFIDINSELKGLETLAGELAKRPDSGSKYDKVDQNAGNGRRIDCTETDNVINLSYIDLQNADRSNPENYNLTDLLITGIAGTSNTLLINVTGLEGVDNVHLPKIIFENLTSESGARYTAQIIWNFGSYDKTVEIDNEFGGVILAPCANVNMGSNLIGSVIAKKFTNGKGEVHFVPNKVKKDSSVQVSIMSVDGTCCPSKEISGVKAVLYKKNGKKYKKVSEAKTGADGFATWTINEEGEYYIREKQGQDFVDFAETPIKCYFKVKKDENGILRVYAKDKAKEGNGESTAFAYTGNEDEKNAAFFKLRHYSNSLYLAANEFGEDGSFTLVSSKYEFKVTNLDKGYTVKVDMAKGLADDFGVAYDIKEAHIKEAGRYQVEMFSKEDNHNPLETKYVDVYLLPVGSYTFVEKEFGDLADAYIGYLGNNYNISKLSATNQKGIKALAGEAAFDTMTDGCLFFNFENADIIS
ncbi:MAG: choice-of-anchor A family protein [Lachnospiraceae bacterium]|nr:choice-of-anchor A family protein [Lachnospiraceae bacterium]